MLRALPALYKVTSTPGVDASFYGLKEASLFRPYLWDPQNRKYRSETRKDVFLARSDDDVVNGIYGKALSVAPTTGEVVDLGIDVDVDLGPTFSLTFVLQPQWDKQPTTSSAFYPFRHGTGPNPRFGFVEDTGTIEVAGWFGADSEEEKSLTYAYGWNRRSLLAATLVVDATANTAKLYVDGVERATLNEAVSANVTGTMRMYRTATQNGTTGKMHVEAYFFHAAALTAVQVETLHKMFTTGLSGESRVVRTFSALAFAFSEMEEALLAFRNYRSIDDATGGALTRIGQDFNVPRKAGEEDDDYRTRIKTRLAALFSDASTGNIRIVSALTTGLATKDIFLLLNEDERGSAKPAFFQIRLPPGNGSRLAALYDALEVAKAAGVQHAVGIKGTFAWDTPDEGWDSGSWSFLQ